MRMLRTSLVITGALLLASAGAYVARPGRGAMPADAGLASSLSREGPDTSASEFVYTHEPVVADDTPHLQVDLPFVNRTGKVLHISKVGHCCGVASAQVALSDLQPGDKTALRLEINLFGRSGPQLFNASLHSQAGDVWTYRVRTTVYERHRFDPPEGIRFGAVDPSAHVTGTAHFLLYSRGGKDFPAAIQFHPSDDAIKVTAGNPVDYPLPNGMVCRKVPVVVCLSAPTMGEANNSGVSATYRTASGGAAEARLAVAWAVKRLYEVAPSRVFFRKTDLAAGACACSVIVRRSDGKPFSVREVKSRRPAITAAVAQPGPAAEHRLLITINPARVVDSVWEEVIVATDHPVQPTFHVPVAAFAPRTK